MPMVVPSEAVKSATRSLTPTRSRRAEIVTGSVPTLACAVNAVTCAGKILRKKRTGLSLACAAISTEPIP